MGRFQIALGLLACALAACASHGDDRVESAHPRLLALAEVESEYAYCESRDLGSIGGFHPDMPDCLQVVAASSTQRDWCSYPQAVRRSAARLETAQALPCAGDADVTPPEAESIIARVIEYQRIPTHPDALDDNETPLLRASSLMWLRARCLADSYGEISRVTGAPLLYLSSGEALLCAALSERWASTRRAMYWSEE